MDYIIALMEGIITFVSPCMLPMLPLYLTYFAGEDASSATKHTLKNSIAFVLGFSAVFISMGAFAGTLGVFLREYHTIISIVAGLIILAFGFNFLGILHISLFDKNGTSYAKKNTGFFSSLLFGIIFSISWTPCISAFLGSALLMASTKGSVIKGTLLLLFYSLGLGIPFILSALFINRLKTAFQFIKNHYSVINKTAGILLLCVGSFMVINGFRSYQPGSQNVAPTLPLAETAANTAEPAASEPPAPSEPQATEAPKIAAPDFTVVDEAGNKVALSSLLGKPVVLNFWASWCPPCKGEMPDFNEVYEEMSEEITFVMVDMTDGLRETKDTGSAFVKEQGFTFPVYYDTDGEAANSYGVYSLPTTYFIDADGNIITGAKGAISKELLLKGISMITETAVTE